MFTQPLHTNWTVQAVGDLSEVPQPLRGLALPAQVPGCIHTDLMRAGKLDDPYLDQNEFKSRWIGHTDWQYTTTFTCDPQLTDHERIDLVFDGLDTVARIVLNDEQVAETQNMHRGYRFDITRRLRRREPNTLTITFSSPVKYAEQMRQKLGSRPYVNGPGGPFNFIRKMACNFGWDWGPALPTCGIWRGIRLEGWNRVRIANVLPRIDVRDDGELRVTFVVKVEHATSPEQLIVSAAVENSRASQRGFPDSEWWATTGTRNGEASVRVVVDNPQLWWPRGYGKQPLYQACVLLHDKSGGPMLDRADLRIGLRTIELDTSPDDIGRKFVLKVNGKPIFCKGFNWIPDDCFLDRACEPARVRQRIQQAIDAGGNMLRVWGGGIFEGEDFYNICDEMGVLVWQDFLFACAAYPEEPPFWDEVEAEARYNVARLAHHPSLAIWNGCNENIWAYRDWGWKDHADIKGPADGGKGRTWGKNYYFDLLPRICRELDPSRPYWAGSPWSGDSDVDNGVPPNAATHGNKHVWEAWFKEDYAVYRTFEPRFCSEFGFQGPANYSSIARVVPLEARDFGSPEMRHRQKSGDRVRDDGDRRNLRHLIRHFNLPGAQELLDALESPDPKAPIPECGAEPLHPAQWPSQPLQRRVNFDDLHYLLSVNQCRALTLGVEWFRSRQPTCMGTLYWQLNDCWPGATSWSCIDGDGKRKPLWYATRKFFANSLTTIQPEADGSLHLCVINDSDQPAARRFLVTRRSFAGEVLAEQELHSESPPRSVRRHRLTPQISTPADRTRELITVGAPVHTTWFFAPDRELHYPPPDFDATWKDGRLTVIAKSLLRDICIFADRIHPQAEVNEQLVTLLPGETFTFEIDKGDAGVAPTTPPVFQCVNRFGAAAL